MEYRLLGSSGSAVSALALGTLTFGQETDEEGSFAQLDRLASGWLTGKYRRGEPLADGTRLKEQPDEGMKKWNERGHLEQNWQVLDVVRKVAGGRGSSLGQVAIAWVLAGPR
jgi:aryl-alcohol dehydrogenase-like predicted oxidoreductase